MMEEIKNALYEYYEIEDDSDTEYGCFINGYWLSIAEILRILEKVVD